jgi:threonine aldolase
MSSSEASPLTPAPSLPAPPQRSFASDNAAGAHPAVVEAVVEANEGHALAYGQDHHTARCEQAFAELFDRDVITRLAFNGTGANIVALSTMLGSRPGPNEAVICAEWAHINVDETGAPERILGTKLIDLPSADAKVTPEQIRLQAHGQGVVHHAQPGVVSITQPTELGMLYTIDEIRAVCETAHDMGLLVHVDGARIANATAALGGTRQTLRDMLVGTGVDAISFGGTKIGAVGAEAVVFLNRECAVGSEFLRKQVTQLASKMRFLAAQFNALLHDDLWLRLGIQANDLATTLHAEVADLPGVDVAPPQVNSIFPSLPADIIKPLQDWSFFWDWDPSINQVRWMTGWDTTPDDVKAFAAGVRHLAELHAA